MSVLPFKKPAEPDDDGSGVPGWSRMTQKAKRALVSAAIRRQAARMLRDAMGKRWESMGIVEDIHNPTDDQLRRDEQMIRVYDKEQADRKVMRDYREAFGAEAERELMRRHSKGER